MLSLINTAISMNKKIGNNYYMRAYIQEKLGNYSSACKDLDKANKYEFDKSKFEDYKVSCNK